MISKSVKYLSKIFEFSGIVIIRFLKILFRRNKNIKIIYLNHPTKHLFESSYIFLHYHFKNAIFYRIGKHITIEKHLLILDQTHFDKEFKLVVYGFFRKKIISLKFEPKLSVNTDNFKVKINNLSSQLAIRKEPTFRLKDIAVRSVNFRPKQHAIKFQYRKIEFKTSNYNQSDFI